MQATLILLLQVAGIGQLLVLIASALVPFRLDWSSSLNGLPRLHRQLYWIYGGYVVLGIVSLGLISLTCASDLASGSHLGRAVCLFGAAFWGIRLSLQLVLEVKQYLTTWWLKAGYHLLTIAFCSFTLIYSAVAFH